MCNVLCHTGMFYYTLGNFRPQLRSTQQAVQLIACVSCSNLQKYGFGPVLEPFIQDANTLYEVSLVPKLLCVGGEKRAWYTLFVHAQFPQDFWEFGNLV